MSSADFAIPDLCSLIPNVPRGAFYKKGVFLLDIAFIEPARQPVKWFGSRASGALFGTDRTTAR
jgi:hypothetical protein